MPFMRKPKPTAELIVRVREEYVADVPVAQIKTTTGLNKHEIYFCLDGGPPGPDQLPPIPRRRNDSRRQVGSPVERLWRAARRQVDAVSQRLRQAGIEPTAVERESRALAMLIKTLRELATVEEARDKARDDSSRADNDDVRDLDWVPRDMDEFRRELARRMDALVARRKTENPEGSQTG
jgi:hypothetical protein